MSFKTTEWHTMLAQCHLPCSAQTNPLFPFAILSGVFHHCRHRHAPLTYFHNSAEVHYCTLCSAANDVNQQATERERAHRDGDVARHKRSRYISTKGLVPLMGLFCSDALISRHDMRSVSVRENFNNATYTKQDYSKSELQRDTQLKKHRINQEIWKTKRFCFNKPFAKWKLTCFPFYPYN